MSPRMIYEQELTDIKTAVREMSEQAEIYYTKLLLAVEIEDRENLKQLLTVNRDFVDMQRKIEGKCLRLITKQQPIAMDLRMVSASLKLVSDLERIGDHVTDMAELFLRLEPPYHQESRALLMDMMKVAKEMVHDAGDAFVKVDIRLAESVIAKDDVVDNCFNQMKDVMMRGIRSQTVGADEVVDVLMLAKYVEKIADHAVTISEWAIFQQTGDVQNTRLL